jgi:uncharacterized circularly permuted ATP-grasp superfamily protein
MKCAVPTPSGPLPGFRRLAERTLQQKSRKRDEAERAFHRGHYFCSLWRNGTERLIPFDIVPHHIPATEWRTLEQGLKRVRAQLFLHDIYHDHAIPRRASCRGQGLGQRTVPARDAGMDVPGRIYAHCASMSSVPARASTVLEDNLRVPSASRTCRESQNDDGLFRSCLPRRRSSRSNTTDLLLENLRGRAPAGGAA